MPRGRPRKSAPKTPDKIVYKTIDEASFRNLVKRLRNAVSDKDEAVATIGGLISSAVEKKNLHKKAFSMFRSLDRLSDTHLATTLAHLDHYREIGGLDERASRQADMVERTEIEETDNVVKMSQAEREETAEFEPEAA